MAKKKNTSIYICGKCSYQISKWLGRCPECGEWNSFSEIPSLAKDNQNQKGSQKLTEIKLENYSRIKTGINEFDRVLGGGVVAGSLVLIGGEPGVGKSTLLTKAMSALSNLGAVLYISGEESVSQIAERSKRIGVSAENYLIYNETSWEEIKDEIIKTNPSFIVLDSIQTTTSNEVPSFAGSPSQVKEVTYQLMNYIKSRGVTCFIIGHMNKEGGIAGPKTLEHMVDVVIYLEGRELNQLRFLRAIKNRFGDTKEVGIFEMNENGLKEVQNPIQHFLEEETESSSGCSISCINQGNRCLLVEIQSLVIEGRQGSTHRVTQGFDHKRLSMLVAIIEKHMGVPLSFNDIYLNVIGGLKLKSNGSDLAVVASLLSSYQSKRFPSDLIFIGEVGLSGEIRSVSGLEKQLKEIDQLNYQKIILSKKSARKYRNKFPGKLIGLESVKDIEMFLEAD